MRVERREGEGGEKRILTASKTGEREREEQGRKERGGILLLRPCPRVSPPLRAGHLLVSPPVAAGKTKQTAGETGMSRLLAQISASITSLSSWACLAAMALKALLRRK